MNWYVEDLITRFQSKGAVVDANLLLLLLIGSYDIELVGHDGFKRVAKYAAEDWATLRRLLKLFKVTVTTPHILTEVSNLAAQLPDHHRSACLGTFVERFKDFAELKTPSLQAASRAEFTFLGLTDCVIAESASNYLVITDDLRFSNYLNRIGLESLNFNHIRTLAWNW
jgi:hypothetical protein